MKKPSYRSVWNAQTDTFEEHYENKPLCVFLELIGIAYRSICWLALILVLAMVLYYGAPRLLFSFAEAHGNTDWTIDLAQRKTLDFGAVNYDLDVMAQFIARHEGFTPTPIPDVSGRGYIIGYGFQPRGRTWMSQKEGMSILKNEVERLITKIVPVYGNVPQNQMTALVSILFNTPTYQSVIRNDDVITAFKQGDELLAKQHLKHSMRGINLRREKELALYFYNII